MMTAKTTWLNASPSAFLLMLAMGTLLGCTDETVFVEVERPPFDQPTETVNNFLGYVGDPADQKPVCANCHATFWGAWQKHPHSHAWQTLQDIGGGEASCYPCHTISDNGNPAEGDAGFILVADDRYTDVQCESCHGSGWDHVNDPGVDTAPLCSILPDVNATTGCGECHQGTHNPFVEQWSVSAHAHQHSFQARSPCNECHEGRTALERKFLETSTYLEKDGPDTQPIFCVVCHDSHGSDYEHELRAPIDFSVEEGLSSRDHLCIRCHSRIGTPPSTHGAHAAQGLLLLQEDIGWLPAGFEAPPLPSHANPQINPELCVSCHVVQVEIEDPTTGEFVFHARGHTFEAIPCLDAQGIPQPPGTVCALTDRDFRACANCHFTEADARRLFTDLKADLNSRLDQLWVDTDGDEIMDPTPEDEGLLPQLVAQIAANPADTVELDPRDALITTAEGVFWNAQVAATEDREYFIESTVLVGLAGDDEDGDGIPDGVEWHAHETAGNGVHNPDFLRDLLDASIQALIEYYGLTP
jgi:hypothetical protein